MSIPASGSCPRCGHRFAEVTVVHGRVNALVPGVVIVCRTCAAVLVVRDEGRVSAATESELFLLYMAQAGERLEAIQAAILGQSTATAQPGG